MPYEGRKWCNKIRHATQAEAIDAAVKAKTGPRRRNQKRHKGAKNYAGTGVKIKTYRCNVCGFFHWTNYVKSSKKKR